MQSARTASFIKRYSLLFYFVLAFGFTWLFWIPRALLSHQIGVSPVLLITLHILGALGPCAAAAFMSARTGGRTGLRNLFRSYLYWRVRPGWYGFVLLLRPVIWLAALGLYALAGIKTAQPKAIDWGFFAAYLLSQPLVVGIGEEAGWSGFALPRMRAHYNFMIANAILGVLWGFWHLPMFFTVGDSQFGASLLLFVVKMFALRCLFSFAYEQTGSLVMPALFHVSANALTELVPLSPNDPLAAGILIAFTLALLVTVRVRVHSTRPVKARV